MPDTTTTTTSTNTLPRLEPWKLSPDAMAGLLASNKALGAGSLDPKVKTLVELRCSQINGCAYCLQSHWKDALSLGEDTTPAGRLAVLAGWREVPERFTERERAALAWAEHLTRVADTSSDALADRHATYLEVRRLFSDTDTAHLGFAIAVINAFNRLFVAFERKLPG